MNNLAELVLAVRPLALRETNIPELGRLIRGKVRDNYIADGKRVLITTDRLSAFDRVLGVVPYKGQVLNQLSAFWFEALQDICPSHMLAVPDPNVMLAHEVRPFPVEVVVRGFITGVTTTSLWYNYERGERHMYGITLPDGLRKNERLPQPVITPTTRGTGPGGHDERITPAEIMQRGLVSPEHWESIVSIALALFRRGQELCERAGIILVDTKYEFGLKNGQIVLIDEVHTPDSSRFWDATTYDSRFAAGQEPDNLDKEFIRMWFVERGYRGEGEPPEMSAELTVQAAERYISVYEKITGRAFEPAAYPAEPRIRRALQVAGILPASA
jgi:phosphoribosylaminoimidazole-succinocarboxamide synthase